MKKKHSTLTLISLMLLAASATFLGTVLALRFFLGAGTDYYGEVRKYAEAREIIAERYVGDYDEAELTDAALAATVAALEDNWSYYLTAEEYEAYNRRTNNQYEGIGITFTRHEETNEIVIAGITSGSPAEEAGLEVGEIITSLEGEPTADMETEDIRTTITEKLGETVHMEIRDEAGALREVEVRSEEFYSNPVSYELVEGDIGYIAIENFDAGSGEETLEAIEALMDDGAESLIFDVRGNPGGRVSELLQVLDYLLPEGEIFVYADRDGNETIETSDADCLEIPIVVLVDENSYSAAEYFGAILQEYGWAEIVGVPTTGKGRSQVTIRMSDGSAVHLSTSRYFTPGRVDLSETGGIQPDLVVELEDTEGDEQLEAAIERLKE